jgi:hypothetical protein
MQQSTFAAACYVHPTNSLALHALQLAWHPLFFAPSRTQQATRQQCQHAAYWPTRDPLAHAAAARRLASAVPAGHAAAAAGAPELGAGADGADGSVDGADGALDGAEGADGADGALDGADGADGALDGAHGAEIADGAADAAGATRATLEQYGPMTHKQP